MDCADRRRILEVCAKIYVLRPVSLTISRIRAKGKEQRTLPVIAATFATAVIGGTLVQLLIG